jgi:DNA gyrase inhibitor GyrI
VTPVKVARVERPETPVACVRAEGSPEAIRAAWARLEELVALRGRRFFGTFDEAAGDYRACVELREGEPAPPGLEPGAIPGGAYLRTRLRGGPPAVYDRILAVFAELVRAGEPDPSRPSIVHCRPRDEADLLLPVR